MQHNSNWVHDSPNPGLKNLVDQLAMCLVDDKLNTEKVNLVCKKKSV